MMDNQKMIRKSSITTSATTILWIIVLASTAIVHFSSEASLYVCAITASSVTPSRDATKDRILDSAMAPLRFRSSKLTTGNKLSQKFVVPYYYEQQQQQQQQPHYHYHYDGRAETNDSNHDEGRGKDTKGGCKTTPKKSKKIKGNDNDTTNCTTPPSSSNSKSPSIAPVTSSDNKTSPTASFLAPTGPPTLGKPSSTDNPSTNTNTAEQLDLFGNDDDGDISSDYYFHFDLHDDHSDVETDEQQHNNSIHDDKKTISRGEGDPNGSSNINTMGRSYYWIIGAVFCVTAYCGGLATSRFCWSKKNDRGKSKNKSKGKRNSFYDPEIAGNANDNNSGTSIQLSVEESVDSYYHDDDEVDDVDLEACEDWSMSVMSWSPQETVQDVIEVGPPSQTIKDEPAAAAAADADTDAVETDPSDAGDEIEDEIEIEFEYDSPEGDFEDIPLEPYVIGIDTEMETNTDVDEEDPPLFDVIDLSNGRIGCF